MKLETKLKVKRLLFTYKWYAVILIGIAIAAWINSKWIEAAILLCCWFSLRYTFPKTFHHKNFYCCVLLSIGIFWLAIPLVVPIQYSLFAVVIVGWGMTYWAYAKQNEIDKFEAKIAELEKLVKAAAVKPKLNPYAMEEEDLYTYCRSFGLDEFYCKIAKAFILDRLKGEDFYKAIGYSKPQAVRLRKKISDILGLKEDE